MQRKEIFRDTNSLYLAWNEYASTKFVEFARKYAGKMILDVGCSDAPIGDVNVDIQYYYYYRGKAKLNLICDGYYLQLAADILVYVNIVLREIPVF